ncbi:MAG TPA: CNP1-like family protein, partial [Ramlibacter sp.]|uniref:CNP1-like family protein n=1 Tax=Ramlibacter sp. TaxID=1917967 RepID=UPI002D805F4C
LDGPPPPALRTTGLIPLEVPGTGLRFGIDPASVNVGKDRIVRYVVVATSTTGAVNAMYEGIRCDAGEVRVYARHNPDSGWVATSSAEWQPLHSAPNTRHSLFIARNGVCLGHAPNGNAAQIVSDLRAPIDRRFERGGVNR